MEDRIPTPGQAGRMLITPEDGSAPFYAKLAMADNPTNPGTPLNKETLLQDNTEIQIFGDSNNRTVDEAFSRLMDRISLLMQSVASMTLTVTDADGNPLEGVFVNGIFDSNGDTVSTNSSGEAVGYVSDGTTTISISGYADLENYSEQFSATKGESYTKTIQVNTRDFYTITQTGNVRFSGNVAEIDVNAVGAGGGGAGGTVDYPNTSISGPGGGGGHSVTQTDVSFTPNTDYQAVIGAGGTAAPGSGGIGGTTSFLGVSAAGGNGGNTSTNQGGTGNGKGGNSVTANQYTEATDGQAGGAATEQGFISFSESGPYGGGGGSGAAVYAPGPDGAAGGGDGGSPGGGTGSTGNAPATTGVGYGGGGGGGSAIFINNGGSVHTEPAAPGRQGCVNLRMHLKTAA